VWVRTLAIVKVDHRPIAVFLQDLGTAIVAVAEGIMARIHTRRSLQKKIAHLRKKRSLIRTEKGDPPDHGGEVLQESIKIPLGRIRHFEPVEISMNRSGNIEQLDKVLLVEQIAQVYPRPGFLKEETVLSLHTNGSGH